MLSHSGIDFTACYVTNVMDSSAPGNNFAHFYEAKNKRTPTKRLEDAWFSLRDKVKRIQPNVVIALGAEPFRALTGRLGIDNWRGLVFMVNDQKIIPTYSPAAVQVVYSNHPIVEMDFAKALKESLTRSYEVAKPIITTAPSLSEALSWMNEALIRNCRVSFDIETIGENIRCIGLAKRVEGKYYSLVIPFMKFPSSNMVNPSKLTLVNVVQQQSTNATSYWSVGDEVSVLQKLSELFVRNCIEKVGHNSIAFDQPIIEKVLNLEINNHYMDTMHAFHSVYLELPKGLDFLCSIYTDYWNYWSDKNTNDDYSEWYYCGMDTVVTLECSYKIEEELKQSKLLDLYFKHVHRLAFALSRAQQTGLDMDVELKDKMAAEADLDLAEILKEAVKLTGKEINLDSSQQVQKLLYEDLKFPVIRNKKDVVSVDEESLKKLFEAYPDEPILKLIIKYRKLRTLNSTFLKAKLDSDGKMRTSWNASGTEGARISSSMNKITDSGMNLQNIPHKIRKLFLAGKSGEDRVFVKGDLSQAEARDVAEILVRYGDSTLHNKFEDPTFDIHTWLAAKIFKCDESKIEKSQRQVGKLGNHSGNYGAGPRVLMAKATKEEIAGITYKFSQEILDARKRAIPGLELWWSGVEDILRKTRTLRSAFGRIRFFFGRLEQSTFRDAYAFEPQSDVGDINNCIFWTLSEKFEREQPSCRTLLQVHDEVTISCLRKHSEYVVEAFKQAAVIPLKINDKFSPLIIPVELAVGENWEDCENLGTFIGERRIK
jgi:DNA polymerase I-like protein with 3'-5' exonuclease and polymerase domains